MNDEDIVKVVNITVQELKKNSMLNDGKDIAYAEMSERLFRYYKCKTGEDAQVYNALHEIRNDPYFRIIPLFYRDNITLEAISGMMYVGDSTIKRNKKRLVLKMYLACS